MFKPRQVKLCGTPVGEVCLCRALTKQCLPAGLCREGHSRFIEALREIFHPGECWITSTRISSSRTGRSSMSAPPSWLSIICVVMLPFSLHPLGALRSDFPFFEIVIATEYDAAWCRTVFTGCCRAARGDRANAWSRSNKSRALG